MPVPTGGHLSFSTFKNGPAILNCGRRGRVDSVGSFGCRNHFRRLDLVGVEEATAACADPFQDSSVSHETTKKGRQQTGPRSREGGRRQGCCGGTSAIEV